MNRKATPDILSALMGEAIKQESNNGVKRASKKAIKQESNKVAAVQLLLDGTEEAPEKAEEELKEKATFNLPVNLLRGLEDRCHEIRKLCGSKQISKTLIVEEALRMAFSEFDLKKETGKFYCKLIGNKAIKQ